MAEPFDEAGSWRRDEEPTRPGVDTKAHRWRVLLGAAVAAFDASTEHEQKNLLMVMRFWAKLPSEARMCLAWVASLMGKG